MTERIKEEHIELWRKEGAVVVPEFFEKIEQEVSNETKNFKIINMLKDPEVYKYLLISFLIF